MAVKHTNNGNCAKCEVIFNRYPNFYAPLKDWFYAFQFLHPEAHISCAGRGEIDQSALFRRCASKALWLQSAHNFNAAIDIFEMGGDDIKNIYESRWFYKVLALEIPDWLTWYGRPNSKFMELPHVEITGWKDLVLKGVLGPVEWG